MTEPTTQTGVIFHPVYFGMLTISCPRCDTECGGVFLAMTTLEDDDPDQEIGELPNMMQVGVVAYPCGDLFATPCLTEKVAKILNAREEGKLRVSMFHNLISCEEHGVEYPGQS